MGWSQKGRVIVNQLHPSPQGLCDRCGIPYNLAALNWQFEWAGARLQNTMFLVCSICMDVPQEQLRNIVLPPDPAPVMNARIENYTVEEDGPDYAVTLEGVEGTGSPGTLTGQAA